jgi:hypothetical protein
MKWPPDCVHHTVFHAATEVQFLLFVSLLLLSNLKEKDFDVESIKIFNIFKVGGNVSYSYFHVSIAFVLLGET